MEISIEDIQNKFEQLPEDIKWAIMGAKIDEKLIEIGNGYKLTVTQMGQLSLETHAVMLGFLHPDKFTASIKASLNLEDEKANLISTDVNNKIIKNIRERLVELHNADKTSSIEETKISIDNKEIEKENIKPLQSTMVNKLLNTVSTNNTKTNYSLDNTTKEIKVENVKKVDPYRMPIE